MDTVHRLEDWIQIKLAYPINKLLKNYVLLNVEALCIRADSMNDFNNDALFVKEVKEAESAISGKVRVLMVHQLDHPIFKRVFDNNGNGNGDFSIK